MNYLSDSGELPSTQEWIVQVTEIQIVNVNSLLRYQHRREPCWDDCF